MAQSNYSDPDLQLESDIADEHHELSSDEELPPRPTSRLGFNPGPTEAVASEIPVAPTRSRAVSLKWTRSLFQKIGIPSLTSTSSPDVDMDITAAPITSLSAEDDEDLDPVSLPILPSLASAAASTSSLNLTDMDVDTGSSCDDEYDDSDSDGYSSGDSDIDIDSPTEYGDPLLSPHISPPTPPPSSPPPAVPPSSPVVPHTAIPTLAPPPPFARRPTPVSSPPIARAKYTCLPSPLSPSSDDRIYYTSPPRHSYGHHGRSRHALLHIKYLWALREDQWDEHTTNMRDNYAYTGMSPLGAPQPPPHHPQRAPSPDFVPMPPMTIHPRRGDLAALRDPYCAHMDRCFVGMPLWTMGKTLWMYDVHMLTGHRARMEKALENTAAGNASEDEESEGESMAASMSTAGFSDDSDETLVESEGGRLEDEMLEEVDLSDDVEKEKELNDVVKPSAPILSLRSRPLDDYLNSKRALALSRSSLPPPPWETSWYKRWEVLLELVRLDTDRERARQGSDPGTLASDSSLAVRPPRFFIGDEEDEGDESWGEERWDEVLAMNREDDVMIASSSPIQPVLLECC
ncbi:hypothetical protein B0H19DRAFT_1101169 [Mycena capillaripes]|nr:hypothetical protein B0H19DRAFT_1101169 [Mycena capillaripes]